jgi:protease I
MKIVDVVPGPRADNLRAVVLTADKFEDMELFVPYFRLLDAGAHVDIAAPTMDEISGEHGYRVAPDVLIDDVDPDLYDLLVIPGGFPDGAPATVRAIPHAQEVARAFFAANKPVASICHGPWLLVSADQVRGRRLTSYWHDGVPEEIMAAGGKWEDSAVVVDGNLVTSRWPPDLPAFTAEMMNLVSARTDPTRTGPSFGSGGRVRVGSTTTRPARRVRAQGCQALGCQALSSADWTDWAYARDV